MKSVRKVWYRARLAVTALAHDGRGVAAIEFAMIVPIMLVLFFGTVEFSSGVAMDRKVTLMARTFSDLVSQNTSVSTTQLQSFYNADSSIMTPYPATPTTAVISELYVDPTTLRARVQWSLGYGGATARSVSSTVTTVPSSLLVGGTYLIFSEINYLYVPTIGYVMNKAGINLSDVAYTRPRQSACVIYPTPTSGALPACPTS
ncbi:MAG TPA: TadE/TadG family type IV pilus assembly protein [Bradyrhizobium sp.]